MGKKETLDHGKAPYQMMPKRYPELILIFSHLSAEYRIICVFHPNNGTNVLKFDEFDRAILGVLQQAGDTPLDRIAEQVNLSRNAVWRRIKLLEDAGVISRRVAILSPDALGLGLTVFLMIRTNDHRPDWLDRFARATRDMPEILGAYRMTGELDYLIRARVSDVKAYDALYQRLTRRVDLADVSASFVMEELKETTALPL